MIMAILLTLCGIGLAFAALFVNMSEKDRQTALILSWMMLIFGMAHVINAKIDIIENKIDAIVEMKGEE